MTHRERVQQTFRFEPADRFPCDLMEANIWPELSEYFSANHGFSDQESISQHLDLDFRWVFNSYHGPGRAAPAENLPDTCWGTGSDALYRRPLAYASSVSDIEAYPWPNPEWWGFPDFAAARERWPEYAIVYHPGWMPLFCTACSAFGMEEALVRIALDPMLFDAFIRRQHDFYLRILQRGLPEAQHYCDICWLGDDYASKDALLISAGAWRRAIKPYLAEQVELVHRHNLRVLLHSCGTIREIIPDLIDIGVDALLVFQTNAKGMDTISIARDFGGKIVFYGGIDCQHLLTRGTPRQVISEVFASARAFADCGGYVIANSHHGMPDIKGQNIEAMCKAAQETVMLNAVPYPAGSAST